MFDFVSVTEYAKWSTSEQARLMVVQYWRDTCCLQKLLTARAVTLGAMLPHIHAAALSTHCSTQALVGFKQ
jgi:hypothetical protein